MYKINIFFRLGKACVDYISCFRRLTDLNVFQNFSSSSRISGLSTAEQCQILLRLKELIHLRRGDFLCEVLEYLESQTNYRNVKLKLKEFWPSEDYYFHTDYQLNLIKKYCPYIENAYFMYKFDCCSNLTQLQCFLCLTGNTIYYVYMVLLLNISRKNLDFVFITKLIILKSLIYLADHFTTMDCTTIFKPMAKV